jgi:hypothetical protein
VRRAAAARAVAAHLDDPVAAQALDEAATARSRRPRTAGRCSRTTCPARSRRRCRCSCTTRGGGRAAELETASHPRRAGPSFHNAAVKDTRALRFRRIPRALRLAGRRAMPQYFEIDDTAV